MECIAFHVLSCASRKSDRFHLLVFGGVAGRKREEAVGAALNIQARCLRAGKSYLFKLRDVRGAFTNVTHESVQQHLEATQRPPEAAINHNQHVITILRTPGGGDWKNTKGTRQGDFGCDILWECMTYHSRST